jgi:hypothetical protein
MAGSSWPALVANQRAKASEVEAKFDWVEADIVPMVAGTRTDATYDLGTSSHRWRDGYFSGNLIHGAGSLGAPSLAKTGDADTGRWYPAADTIAESVGGVEAMRIASAGYMTRPLQTSFLATSAVAQSNVVGASAGFVTVAYASENFDIGANYNNGTYTFTAPVTGKYQFNFYVQVAGLQTSTHTSFQARLVTTGKTFLVDGYEDDAGGAFALVQGISFGTVAAMTAGDTALVQVTVGAGSQDADIEGGFFSGFLIG